ncbi:hypothetical protein PUR71_33220 [Streptomyces sp. SP17BM10]|uniref:hypothetical protein n=1 Tax=Streptomyces sp. SP17BM10 TaxID=3002530 RepID=UPI002E776C8E|nr:hypothetical protein [Streptomyces sp. SP17BM10]MEE1787733.1 hypothetical protein [Streptomyces sp. SP17BM10]
MRQSAGPDTVRGAARRRIADRITNGPRDCARPDRSPAGPETVRGAARQRVADRITTGSWKPTGGNKNLGGATPTTIRGALRARAVERIRNGHKPKAGPDSTGQQAPAGPDAKPSTDLTVRPDPSAGAPPGAGSPAPSGSKARKAKHRRKPRRVVTLGGATGARPWRSRPGRGRASRERRRRRPWWDRTERARNRRRYPRNEPGGGAWTSTHGNTAGPAGSGFGPPPGWGWAEGETHTVHRADRPGPHTAGAIGRGQAALPRAPYRSGHARPGTTAPPPPPPAGGAPVTIPAPRTVRGTQYTDSDLTIYDVIEADADMGEEIAQGAAEAKQTAEGCDLLIGRLEALHAKVVELKVPGVLERMVVSLIDKTGQVKARAEAIAEKIPVAAEAITAAGDNAADRHKGLADAVRDAGHTAPAERDYHNE